MRQKQRRKSLIDAKTQGVILRKALFHWVVFLVCGMFFGTIVQICAHPFEPISTNLTNSIKGSLPMLLTFACLCPIFAYDFLKLSNRVFGPVIRIRKTIRKLAQGKKAEKINTRKKDCHGELVRDVNRLIEIVQSNNDAFGAQSTRSPDQDNAVNSEIADDIKTILNLVRAHKLAEPDLASVAEEHHEC
ncbi:MAG: hypothetical protein AAGA30_00710 [Planctomycetota bacterium]